MAKDPLKVSLIIPTRNEEGNIKTLLKRIWDALVVTDVNYEVVIVDDSDDATAVIAASLGGRVVQGRRKGLAQAVLDGIYASGGDAVIVIDADLQHPPEMLPEVVRQLRVHDLVVVSKHIKGAVQELSWWRKVQSSLGIWAGKVFIPAPVSDTMTGFFGIRRKCLENIKRCTGYSIDKKKLQRFKKQSPDLWNELEQSRSSNWDELSEYDKGKWYCERGYASETSVYYQIDNEKLEKLKKKKPEDYQDLEEAKPDNWCSLNEEEQGKWYYGKGYAVELIGLEAIGFKIGLELFTKAKWVSHAEIPLHFVKREKGQSKGTAHSLHKHLWRLFKNSLNYDVVLPKGSEEYYNFYEGTEWQKKWKQNVAYILRGITCDLKPTTVLDVGCGSSPNINFLYGKCVGIDIRQDALNWIKDYSDAEFKYGSVLDIPYPAKSFDCVVCIEVLEHLYSEEVDKALSELSRVVKDGGYVILATPNYSSIMWVVLEKIQTLVQRFAWTSDHKIKFNCNKLGELCKQYSMHQIRYDGVMANMDMVITYQKVSGSQTLFEKGALAHSSAT